MSDESQNTKPDQTQETEKQTNRVFTQSELDSFVAAERRKAEQKFSDYEDLQSKLSEMEAQAKEKAEAEMSELEKSNSTIKELSGRLENLQSENISFKRENLRNEILADSKFNSLPRAYKNMVSLSDNAEEISASAENVLKEYEQDFGGKSKPDIKPPDSAINSGGVVTPENSVSTFSAGIKSKMANLIKNRG
jgi:hypothetical protein